MPLYLYTPDLAGDLKHFKYELEHIGNKKIQVTHIRAMGGDLIPESAVLSRDNVPFLVLLNQSACHSYYSLPLQYEKVMRVATLDTLITLYFSMALLKYKFLGLASMECLAQELVSISYRARNRPDAFPFPFISLTCAGHQTGLPSLIRAKVKRLKTSKRKITELMASSSKSASARTRTMKRKLK
jgi:hypothetical protein